MLILLKYKYFSIEREVRFFVFSFISIKLKLAEMPSNSNWIQLYGIGILTGIGFTMSLFVGNLAFPNASEYLDGVKIGVLAGSLLSTLAGYGLLILVTKKIRINNWKKLQRFKIKKL